MSSLHDVAPASRTHGTGRDLAVAWVATAVVVGLLALMPSAPSIAEAWGFDLEGASFLVALAVLAGFVVVLDGIATVAVVFGRRAARSGRQSGWVPVTVSGLSAAFITLMLLLSAVGHLLGME